MGKVYFHADDYGRSKEVSKNILKCLTKGNLNSVSIMIDHDQKCHKKLKKLKNVNKRLHLNLTELPVKKNKNQFISNLSFIKLLFIDELKKKKILEEIDIQIKKFKKIYNPKELKIDGHEHIHMIPWILEYLLKNRKYYKIKELRNSDERLMSPRLVDLFNLNYIRNFIACIIVKILYNLKKPKMNAPCFSGLLYSGMQNIETIKKTLLYFKKKKIKNYEILVHPGYTNKKEKSQFKESYFNFYNSQNRKTEFDLCFSKEVKKELKI